MTVIRCIIPGRWFSEIILKVFLFCFVFPESFIFLFHRATSKLSEQKVICFQFKHKKKKKISISILPWISQKFHSAYINHWYKNTDICWNVSWYFKYFYMCKLNVTHQKNIYIMYLRKMLLYVIMSSEK